MLITTEQCSELHLRRMVITMSPIHCCGKCVVSGSIQLLLWIWQTTALFFYNHKFISVSICKTASCLTSFPFRRYLSDMLRGQWNSWFDPTDSWPTRNKLFKKFRFTHLSRGQTNCLHRAFHVESWLKKKCLGVKLYNLFFLHKPHGSMLLMSLLSQINVL